MYPPFLLCRLLEGFAETDIGDEPKSFEVITLSEIEGWRDAHPEQETISCHVPITHIGIEKIFHAVFLFVGSLISYNLSVARCA
jgi:hypothetical protein